MKTGTIKLKSGIWHWYIVDLFDVPSWKIKIKKLNLVDPSDERNEMVVDLPRDGDVTDEMIPALSRHPNERRVVASGGIVWVVSPIDPPKITMAVPLDFVPPHHRIYFQARDRNGRTADLPKGIFLGDLTNAELLELVDV